MKLKKLLADVKFGTAVCVTQYDTKKTLLSMQWELDTDLYSYDLLDIYELLDSKVFDISTSKTGLLIAEVKYES